MTLLSVWLVVLACCALFGVALIADVRSRRRDRARGLRSPSPTCNRFPDWRAAAPPRRH